MSDPYGPAEFAQTVAKAGPFETNPHIAVACSGGPDSMALALLAGDWARAAGGKATALIVDHGMRPEAGAEAVTVRDRLAARGVDAAILTRQGPAFRSDRQAAARQARYELMTAWCRRMRVLHLFLGHQRGDQAETLMLRLGRGSGLDGLAAIPAVSETPWLRLVRPLLDVPRSRLLAFLRSRQTEWVEDPSNEDDAFSRVRMRGLLPDLEREGFTEQRLAATARRMARARAAVESAATDLLAASAAVYPEGYAVFSPQALLAAPEEVGLRALARLLACVGGNLYGPRLERLERLYNWLGGREGSARTLAGCRIQYHSRSRAVVSREAAAMAEPVPAREGAVWDGRFMLTTDGPPGAVLARLGQKGRARLRRQNPDLRIEDLPAGARTAVPAVWRLEEVVAVPHFQYRAKNLEQAMENGSEIAFLPARPLGPARFESVAGYA